MPETKQNKKLTIIVVSFYGREMVEAHINLTQKLNPNQEHLYKWLIVENSPDAEEQIPQYQINEKIDYQIIEGVPKIENAEYLVSWGSISHALSLNKAVQQIHSEYALFIDHDCLIVQDNWIHNTLEHMENKELSFLGVPYFPSNYRCYRYFPCAICMFVDLKRVSMSDLDFMPQDHIYIKAHLLATLGPFKLFAIFLAGIISLIYYSIFNNQKKENFQKNIGINLWNKQGLFRPLKKLFPSSFKGLIKEIIKKIKRLKTIVKNKLLHLMSFSNVIERNKTFNQTELEALSIKGIHLNKEGKLLPQVISELLFHCFPFFAISSYKDTGWHVYNKYFNSSKHECTVPVWEKSFPKFLKIPDKYSLIPQHLGYFINHYNNPTDPAQEHIPLDWERYLWKDKIFCFHAASVGHRQAKDREERVMIIKSIAQKIQPSTNESTSHS